MGSVRVPDRFQEVWPKEWRENIFPLTFPDESQPPSEVSLVPLSNWALTPIQVRSFKAWLRKVPWICFRSESWVVKQNPHLNGKGNRWKFHPAQGPQAGQYLWLVKIPYLCVLPLWRTSPLKMFKILEGLRQPKRYLKSLRKSDKNWNTSKLNLVYFGRSFCPA